MTVLLDQSGILIRDFFASLETLARTFPREKVEQAVDLLYETWEREGTVFVAGNGGSASTSSHFACDLSKFSMVKGQKRLKVLSLVDNIPLVSAWTNDSGFATIFSEQLDPWLKEGDLLVAISVHGGSGTGQAGPWSQNLGRAVELARQRGARILGLSGFKGGLLAEQADECLVVPIEAEPLGTPLVESFHVVLHHLLCLLLHQRIKAGSRGDHI